MLAGLLVAVASCGGDDPEPGEVLDHDDVAIADGVAGRRIRYGSIDVTGDATDVTGLLAVPGGAPPAGGWPIVAYAHSTSGGGDDCAPSEDPSRVGVGGAVAGLAAAGYVVVATDYEGIGTSGPHPYLNGPSEARAIVDSVRAARALVPDTSPRWAVVGHSQGGHAALFTAELAAEMAPDLELVGAVAIAPVTDVARLTDAEGFAGTAFLVLAVAGFLETDPGIDGDDLLTDAGKEAVGSIEDSCELAIATEPLLAQDSPELQSYLAAQAPGRRPTAVPILVQQGEDDPLTVPSVSRDFVARACSIGDVVDHREYEGVDHLEVVAAGQADALAFLAARFAVEPATSSCSA